MYIEFQRAYPGYSQEVIDNLKDNSPLVIPVAAITEICIGDTNDKYPDFYGLYVNNKPVCGKLNDLMVILCYPNQVTQRGSFKSYTISSD